jgi:hypothetical protein
MARKNRNATADTVATRREMRRRRWNRAEARGHRDHADTLPRTAARTEVTR